jgi:hypothetical protein
MSRSDIKELGETIDAGEASLLVVGENKLEQTLNTTGLNAEKCVVKQLDVNSEDLDKAVREAAKEVS